MLKYIGTAFLLAVSALQAQTVTVTVPGNTMPWLYNSLVAGGLNSSYAYGNNDGISPVVLSPAQGFNFTAGSHLTITFAGGAISLGTGISSNDASGNPSFTANNPAPGIAPSYYMSNVASPI